MSPSFLSKTNFLCGMQCPKLLWTVLNDAKSIPQPDAATQFSFDQGHEVGSYAKRLFPGGLDIPTGDFSQNLRDTRAALKAGKPLFEAGILGGKVFCRPDVLSPNDDGSWDIIEVKSAASIKDQYYLDVAFQRYCCECAGLSISKCRLAYINNKYVRHGEIEPGQLFNIEDITEKVNEKAADLNDAVVQVLAVMGQRQCPECEIGLHCNEPYDCALQELCWSFLPEHNIFDLYQVGKKAFELYQRGVVHLKDIPDNFSLNGRQQIQVDCAASGLPHADKAEINKFLTSLTYPLYCLDFETFGTAIPLFEGIRPFQQIPFQFSLHVVPGSGTGPEHFSHLAEGQGDPRPALAAALRSALGENGNGSIVAYSASFEKKVLEGLADLPGYGEWANGLQGRIVDLLKPFSSFHYYHPDQKGSASLKRVMPAVTGITYEGLSINDGKVAGAAFLGMQHSGAGEEERRKVRENLLEYCGQDTCGMVEIIKRLDEMSA